VGVPFFVDFANIYAKSFAKIRKQTPITLVGGRWVFLMLQVRLMVLDSSTNSSGIPSSSVSGSAILDV
jgi:hypothetical protein